MPNGKYTTRKKSTRLQRKLLLGKYHIGISIILNGKYSELNIILCVEYPRRKITIPKLSTTKRMGTRSENLRAIV